MRKVKRAASNDAAPSIDIPSVISDLVDGCPKCLAVGSIQNPEWTKWLNVQNPGRSAKPPEVPVTEICPDCQGTKFILTEHGLRLFEFFELFYPGLVGLRVTAKKDLT